MVAGSSSHSSASKEGRDVSAKEETERRGGGHEVCDGPAGASERGSRQSRLSGYSPGRLGGGHLRQDFGQTPALQSPLERGNAGQCPSGLSAEMPAGRLGP